MVTTRRKAARQVHRRHDSYARNDREYAEHLVAARGHIGSVPVRALEQSVAHAPLVLTARAGRGVRLGRLLEDASRWLVDEAGELPNVVGNPEAREHHSGDATAGRESASEEGSPSGTDSAPERSRCGPLLESCAAMPLATRRLDPRNEGPSVIDVAGQTRPRMTKPLSREGQVPPGLLVASPRRPPLRPPRRPRVAAPTACRRSLILRSPPASRRANRPSARGRGARQSHDRVARGAACAHCDSACSDCAFPPARATHSRP